MKKKLCRTFLVIIGLLSIYSCNNNDRRPISKSTNDYSDSISTIEKKVMNGDTVAYNKLRVAYMESSFYPKRPYSDFLPWCKLMADKYSYAPACVDVYYVILTSKGLNLSSIDSLDVGTKQLALRYLNKGAQLNNEISKQILAGLKRKGVVVD